MSLALRMNPAYFTIQMSKNGGEANNCLWDFSGVY